MRKIPGGIQRLACAMALVLLWSCKEKAPEPAGTSAKTDVERRSGKSSSDTGFSPAEIRRSGSRSLDSTPVAEPTQKTDSVVAAKPAEKPAPTVETPVVAEKPPAAKPAEPPKPPVVAPKPAPATSAPVAGGEAPGAEGEWVLQINIHKSEAEARAQVQKLAEQGITAYAIPVPTGETKLSGDYWRVRVGRFKERAKAQAWGEANIVSRGLKFWVDKKSNENRSAGNP
ncbi:MAG: SPOR domain-containing protein [Fibrobacterota bacterium]|nr:SPOR domain-containing protein [Fibrobacterota bacterium]QQS04385.1 MAG: SPOR domain-containing protein [Fibrobacterota bacterium]